MPDLNLESFIYTVKKQLLEAQEKHAGELAYFNLQDVELEVTLTTSLQGDGSVKLAVTQLGSKISKENAHTVRLRFKVVATKTKTDRRTRVTRGKVAYKRR